MSERKVQLLLQDIQTSITRILNYTGELTLEQYEQDTKTRDAVERNFEIIGEAASRVPADFQQKHSHIEWRIIKDFRNFIIHEYFGINNVIVWDIVQNQLPTLLLNISTVIEKTE